MIKPCPFCNNDKIRIEINDKKGIVLTLFIKCLNIECFAIMSEETSIFDFPILEDLKKEIELIEQRLIERWNRRIL